MEYDGAVRFYFQDSTTAFVTKCVRISSTATTSDVVSNLVSKFRGDMRMLSKPDYKLYEAHQGEGKYLKCFYTCIFVIFVI